MTPRPGGSAANTPRYDTLREGRLPRVPPDLIWTVPEGRRLDRNRPRPAAGDRTLTPALSGPAGFDELNGSLEKGEILLVVGRIGAIDLDPLSRACHAARLERNEVVLRKLQFRRDGNGQA